MARTQVGIVGAGPAGLVLARLLSLEGVESVVIESRDRGYVESRVRAGVLEHGTAELLEQIGVGQRMREQGLVHRGVALRFAGRSHRIDFVDLTGKTITVYGQQEIVKDLIAARLRGGGEIQFESEVEALDDLDGRKPMIRYRDRDGVAKTLVCDFVAGCDGFHGVCRNTIPTRDAVVFDRTFPFSWFGILAETRPPSHEVTYTNHERGLALISMRSETISRLYLQCAADDDIAAWPDERFWQELQTRLSGDDAPYVREGPVLQRGITPMRSFVLEPMRYKRLFLAGDAAHIVPPTGAKGMNLAVADVVVLARALALYFAKNDADLLDAYSDTCLRRVWRTQRFSAWMTSLFHRFESPTPFEGRLQLAELEHLTSSRAAAQNFAESYVGLPFDGMLDGQERA
jgi:p-hydroxybenzoate 3-monooxygenase